MKLILMNVEKAFFHAQVQMKLQGFSIPALGSLNNQSQNDLH